VLLFTVDNYVEVWNSNNVTANNVDIKDVTTILEFTLGRRGIQGPPAINLSGAHTGPGVPTGDLLSSLASKVERLISALLSSAGNLTQAMRKYILLNNTAAVTMGGASSSQVTRVTGRERRLLHAGEGRRAPSLRSRSIRSSKWCLQAKKKKSG